MNADAVAALRTIADWQTHGPLQGRDAEAMVEVARAALAAAPLPEPVYDFAWLIERGQPEGQVPTVWWWLAAGGREGWTEVATEAFHFESREAAEEIIAAKFTPPTSRGEASARAVEHSFIAAAPLPSEPCPGCEICVGEIDDCGCVIGHEHTCAPLPSDTPAETHCAAHATYFGGCDECERVASDTEARMASDTPARTMSFDSVNATGRPSDTPADGLDVHNPVIESADYGLRVWLSCWCGYDERRDGGSWMTHRGTPIRRRPMNADAVAALLNEGVEAFRLTREYVGEDLLPAQPGWSWFDWCEKVAALAAAPLPSEPPATHKPWCYNPGVSHTECVDKDGFLPSDTPATPECYICNNLEKEYNVAIANGLMLNARIIDRRYEAHNRDKHGKKA